MQISWLLLVACTWSEINTMQDGRMGIVGLCRQYSWFLYPPVVSLWVFINPIPIFVHTIISLHTLTLEKTTEGYRKSEITILYLHCSPAIPSILSCTLYLTRRGMWLFLYTSNVGRKIDREVFFETWTYDQANKPKKKCQADGTFFDTAENKCQGASASFYVWFLSWKYYSFCVWKS